MRNMANSYNKNKSPKGVVSIAWGEAPGNVTNLESSPKGAKSFGNKPNHKFKNNSDFAPLGLSNSTK